MSGQLFTHYFLTDGIRATPEWQASAADPETFAAFRKESVLQRYEALARSADPNEAVTEQDLIRPVLELLGWTDYLPQQGTARNEDIPDHLLFADAGSKERASAEPNAAARARHAAVVEESKRFGLPLDERDREAGFHARSPHSQILRYLATAEIESESRVRWGLLTNGGVWRLYDYRARPRASGYFEADLADLLEARPRRGPARLPPAVPAGAPSRRRRAPPTPSSRRPWPRAAATRNRSPRTSRGWSSRASSRRSSRPLRMSRREERGSGQTCRRSTRRP